MGVTLLSEHRYDQDPTVEDALERLRGMGAEAKGAPERVVVKRVLPDREILQAMTALGTVLAVRLMLLLAVIGAFALAWTAIQEPDALKIWILGVYAVLIVAPLVWLSTKRT